MLITFLNVQIGKSSHVKILIVKMSQINMREASVLQEDDLKTTVTNLNDLLSWCFSFMHWHLLRG